MRFHTRDGTVVLVSPLGDRALMDVTPLTFLSRLVATNQTLRYRNMAEYDIDSIFKGILASASVTSYEIKAERKGILEHWESSSDWAAIRQILRCEDTNKPGTKPKPSIPLEIRYSGTKTPLLVQHMSERTREKLVCMGKSLRVYLPSRDDSGALTDTTHIHLVGHNETGGSELYQVEIVPAFHPSVAIEFKSSFLLKRLVDELPTSAFSFDYDRAANVAAEIFDAKAHDTIYTLGSGPLNEGHAIYESLKRFFTNKGYVPKSDIVSKEEEGVKMTYVVVHCKQGPTFIRKLSAVPGQHRDQLVPATFAETCYICQPYKKRAQPEYQSYLQVETQSRQELDLRPTGPPRVKLPGQEVTPPALNRQPDTGSQLKRKRDVQLSNTTGPKHIDNDREEARMKLKEANEAPMSKLKCDNLPASLHGPEPLHDDRNDRNKKRKVLENSLPPKRKRENSLGNIIGLQPSRYGSKDVNKLPMFGGIKDGSKTCNVVGDGVPPKRKRESSSNSLVGRKPSCDGSKDTYKKPKFAEKEVLTSEDCAELARDFLTELEESLNS